MAMRNVGNTVTHTVHTVDVISFKNVVTPAVELSANSELVGDLMSPFFFIILKFKLCGMSGY